MITLNDTRPAYGSAEPLLPKRVSEVLRTLEAAMIVVLGVVIYVIYLDPEVLELDGRYVVAIATAVLIYLTFGRWLGIHQGNLRIGDPYLMARTLGAWTLTFCILLALAFMMKVSSDYSRVWAVTWFVGISISLPLARAAFGQWLIRRAAQGEFALRTVIVGRGPEAQEVAGFLREIDDYQLRFLGLIDERASWVHASTHEANVLGNLDRLMEMIRSDLVDQVIIALPPSPEEYSSRVLHRLSLTPVSVAVMPFPVNHQILNKKVGQICGVPVVEVLSTPMSDGPRALKWFEDQLLGFLLLLFVAPLMAVIAAAIKLDSRGPIFFKQIRQGYNDSLFPVWKFRTMYHDFDGPAPFRQATRRDPRVTRVGAFLRRSSLDELPQLFNVLNGTMSLVGPRPHPPETESEGKRFEEAVDRYAARHRVKPGITGLAQVHGWRGETDTVEKIKRRVDFDLYYIEHWSLWLDLWILTKTIWVILRDKNAY